MVKRKTLAWLSWGTVPAEIRDVGNLKWRSKPYATYCGNLVVACDGFESGRLEFFRLPNEANGSLPKPGAQVWHLTYFDNDRPDLGWPTVCLSAAAPVWYQWDGKDPVPY